MDSRLDLTKTRVNQTTCHIHTEIHQRYKWNIYHNKKKERFLAFISLLPIPAFSWRLLWSNEISISSHQHLLRSGPESVCVREGGALGIITFALAASLLGVRIIWQNGVTCLLVDCCYSLLGVRIIWPNGVTSLLVDCCYSALALLKSQLSGFQWNTIGNIFVWKNIWSTINAC